MQTSDWPMSMCSWVCDPRRPWPMREVMIDGQGGIRIVPAASGAAELVNLGPREHAGLIQAFSDIGDELDILLIDTAAGIGDSVVSFVRAAQEVIVEVRDEPT